MKNILHIISVATLLLLTYQSNSQVVSDFENITLSPNSFYNGSDYKGGFASGSAYFTNMYSYDSVFGAYWEGFSVSNKKDDSTSGFLNQYSAITGGGFSSANYGVFYSNGKIRLTGAAIGKSVSGFAITNSTYAYMDMKTGSAFSKKFGGTSGNDPDYLRIVISAWKNGGNAADTSIKVYLADFRFTDNSKDYILKTWKNVDLTMFGVVDSFGFYFESSDTSGGYINTPSYFCIDNFNGITSGIETIKGQSILNVYPNPAKEILNVVFDHHIYLISIVDIKGEELIRTTEGKINIQNLPSGIYLIQVQGESGYTSMKFIKE